MPYYRVEDLQDFTLPAWAVIPPTEHVAGHYYVTVWASLPRKNGTRFRLKLVNEELRSDEPVHGVAELAALRRATFNALADCWSRATRVRVWFYKGRPYGKLELADEPVRDVLGFSAQY